MTPSDKIAIVADDLTGALDTAVPFAQRGLTSVVVAAEGTTWPCETNHPVLVIDTETRHVAPDEAKGRAYKAFRAARQQGATYFYKKVDSTLRGNIGAEIESMLEAGIGSEVILTPALPAHGRTVRGGALYVHGVPVASTHFGRDPLNPVTESDLRALVASQSSVPVWTCRDPSDLPPPSTDAHDRRIIVVDAASEADLLKLAQTLASAGRARLCAGSAGFAAALAQVFYGSASIRPFQISDRRVLPALIVCGSLHPASRKAVTEAEARGYPRLTLPTSVLLDEEPRASRAAEEIAERAARLMNGNSTSLASRGLLMVETQSCSPPSPAERFQCLAVAERLACLVERMVAASGIATVVAFGGDTAAALARALSPAPILPEGEILPGVVVSRIERSDRSLSLVTKAGGYEHDRLIEEIWAWLKQNDEPRR